MREQLPGKRIILLISSILLVISPLFAVSCGDDDDDSPGLLVTRLNPGEQISDRVVLNGFRSYSAAVIPGVLYKISMIAPTDDADLLFFGSDSSFSTLFLCGVDNTEIEGNFAEDCIIAASGNMLYFAVDGTFLVSSSADYTISIESLEIISLTPSVSFLDAATRTSASVYAVSISPGTYTASISGLSDDAELYVFNNANLSVRTFCGPDNTQFIGTTPEDCTFSSSGITVYLVVDGIFSTTDPVLFTVLVTPA